MHTRLWSQTHNSQMLFNDCNNSFYWKTRFTTGIQNVQNWWSNHWWTQGEKSTESKTNLTDEKRIQGNREIESKVVAIGRKRSQTPKSKSTFKVIISRKNIFVHKRVPWWKPWRQVWRLRESQDPENATKSWAAEHNRAILSNIKKKQIGAGLDVKMFYFSIKKPNYINLTRRK